MPPTGQAVYVTLSPLSARASGSLYALPSSTDTEKAKGALNWNEVNPHCLSKHAVHFYLRKEES